MILVAGPYRSGTDGDPARIAANVDAMTAVALELYRRGHLPVMGEWFALPLIEQAPRDDDGGDPFEEIFHPVAERLLERCDACLRIGGPSEGADRMVATARRSARPSTTISRRFRDRPGRLQQVRDDDRRGRARARRAARLLRRASGCRTSRSTSPSGPWPPTSSSSTRRASSGRGRRACRCPSATRRS